MVTLVGCAISYISLFWCPIIFLNYFWYIKYWHIIPYEKNGKRKEKIKRKVFPALLGRGGILAHPGASARARARELARLVAQLAQQRGTAEEWRCGAGPTCQRGGGSLTVRAVTEGGGGRLGSDRRWESAAVLRRGSGSAAGRWWCCTGGSRRSLGWGQFDRRGPRAAGPRRGGGCPRR
jgi:hypothetical protein